MLDEPGEGTTDTNKCLSNTHHFDLTARPMMRNKNFLRTLILLGSLMLDAPAAAEDQPTLARLFADADLVALARVEQTDYEKTRDFPSSGSAILKVLIPYKGIERGQIFEVAEQGLEETACYYPELAILQIEGDRFLVFANSEPSETVYRGFAPGCKIPVAVMSNSLYAIIAPVPGLTLPEEVIEEVEFADPAAFVDATEFTSAQIKRLETLYHARAITPGEFEPNFKRYVYTRGVPISGLRRLLSADSADQASKSSENSSSR